MPLFSCANYVPTLKGDIVMSLKFFISSWLFFPFSLATYISMQPPESSVFFLAFEGLSWRQVKGSSLSFWILTHFYSDILSSYSLHNLKSLAANCDHPSPDQLTQASFWLPLWLPLCNLFLNVTAFTCMFDLFSALSWYSINHFNNYSFLCLWCFVCLLFFVGFFFLVMLGGKKPFFHK